MVKAFEPAAEAIEDLARERFEERGYFLVRIGKAPKRAVLFRTDVPFKKLTLALVAPDGGTRQKIEILGDGQQVVVHGIHPETEKPYSWHGGEPWEIAVEDLPYISEDIAREFLADAAKVLEEFGYTVPKTGKGAENEPAAGGKDMSELVDAILAGQERHDSIRDLAAKLVVAGMGDRAAINLMRSIVGASTGPRDREWQKRYDDIPRAVRSARKKFIEPDEDEAPKANGPDPAAGGAGGVPPVSPGVGPGPLGPSPASPPSAIEDTLRVFEKWLILPSWTPVLAMLGTVAANLLPGEPTWLGLIAPPSSAKTELINALIGLPFVVSASTLTPAGLLSGTPQRQRARGAKGGLLKQVSNPGLLCLKDFTSILTMRPEAKAEILGVLREVYDGHYVRRLGTDGGRELEWKGKLGLIFACTNVIDTHYSVENALGNRFLLSRLSQPDRTQFKRALKHTGASLMVMRREIADSVTALFAIPRPDPQPLDPEGDEFKRLDRVVNLVVRLRGAVERDRYKRDIQSFHGAEGPARIGLALERLLAGLDTLGVDRAIALDVIEAVAMDSVSPIRRSAYEYLCQPVPGAQASDPPPWRTTREVANRVRLPVETTRRTLEEMFGYDLCEYQSGGQGKAGYWRGIVAL